MSLENAIRPFLPTQFSVQVRPRRGDRPGSNEPPQLVIEARGDMIFSKVIRSAQSSGSIYAQRTQVEQQRTYDLVRVKNPDDDQQYVDVEVARQIRTQIEGAAARRTVKYAEQPAAENIEILAQGLVR